MQLASARIARLDYHFAFWRTADEQKTVLRSGHRDFGRGQ
jgi:hypothetical protein